MASGWSWNPGSQPTARSWYKCPVATNTEVDAWFREFDIRGHHRSLDRKLFQQLLSKDSTQEPARS
jgi:hypothetical protein